MQKIDKSVYLAPGSYALGEVSIGADSSIWFNAVVRGDLAPIRIGERTNIQDNAVLHGDEGYCVTLGDDVTVGHGAIVHGCEVGDNTIIGMGAILLNGCKVGKNCIIGAGALVKGGTVIPDGSMAVGSPAKVRRALTEDEIASIKANADEYCAFAKAYKKGEYPAAN